MKTELLDITIWDVFQQAMEKYPKSHAITYKEQIFTFEELDERTSQVAAYLYEQGIRPGDSVAILMDTNPDAMCIYYGIWKLGAIAVLLNPLLQEAVLQHMLSLSSPRMVIREMPCPFPAGKPEEFFEAMRRGVDGKAAATLVFTSGTTSMPKAVPLTQFRMLNSARTLAKRLQAGGNDRFCAVLPIFHSFCISVNMLIPLMTGACTCIAADRHTYTVLSLIERERCTILSGVPTMFHSITEKKDLEKYDISSLRAGFIGGSYCAPEQFRVMEEKLSMCLLSTLGQTECTGGFTSAFLEDSLEKRSRSVGRPMEHMEVSIQSPDGTCLEQGASGEICVRGYLVMDGYWRDEEKTRETIKNGWLHTGDLGWKDEEGFVFVSGRMKNIIIHSGENISPSEVEDVILRESYVEECKVVGIPDVHYGEELCACIRFSEDCPVNLEGLKEKLKQELPDFKVPRYLLEFETFPKTGIGKVKTEEVKKLAIERLGGKKL